MEKKNELQLGMSRGKAQHILRVMITFDLVKKCGLDNCYRCGRKIESVAEFSIDHKKAWLDVDVSLFWDLGNIAFSHKTCNYRCKRMPKERPWLGNAQRKKSVIDGEIWCGGHQAFLKKELFSKNCRHWNGYQDCCKECRSKARSPGKYLKGVVL